MRVRIPGRREFSLGLGLAALLGATLVGTGGASSAATPGPPPEKGNNFHSVPEAIRVPAGNRMIARFDGKGVQVCQCAAGAWAFVEPAATLDDHRTAAIHFRGPSWESIQDGSLVEAAAVANS